MSDRPPRLPPRWFVRVAWAIHRGLYEFTGGRAGLWRPREAGGGMLRLRTTGRRTGAERAVMLGYLEDGRDLILLAMNGWAEPEPAWWLNLQTHPQASVDLPGESRRVRARPASAEEQQRYWQRMAAVTANLDRYAALRGRESRIVILEPDG